MVNNNRVFPIIAFGDRISLPLQTTLVTVKAPRFSGGLTTKKKIVFGKIDLATNIRALDRDRRIVELAITISLELGREVVLVQGEPAQTFRFLARIPNIFTGEIEEVRIDSTRFLSGSLSYLEKGINPKVRPSFEPGKHIGQILFCEFSDRDSMQGDDPNQKRLDDFATR